MGDKKKEAHNSKLAQQVWHSFRDYERTMWKAFTEGQHYDALLEAHVVDDVTLMQDFGGKGNIVIQEVLKPPDPSNMNICNGLNLNKSTGYDHLDHAAIAMHMDRPMP